jgi:hypothetical protein
VTDDPTLTDPVAYALALAHPVIMLVSMGLVGFALLQGMQMRTARKRRLARGAGVRRRHLLAAKLGLALGAVGVVLGPASAVLMRGWSPLATGHGWIAIGAVAFAAAAGIIGRQLEHGRSVQRDAHGALALVAVMLGLAASLTGLEHLP